MNKRHTLTLLLLSAGCTRPNPPSHPQEIIEFQVEEGMTLGSGYDSLTGDVKERCVELGPLVNNLGVAAGNTEIEAIEHPGLDVESSFELADSYQAIVRDLQIDPSTLLTVKAQHQRQVPISAKLSMVANAVPDEFAIYAAMKISVRTNSQRLQDFKLLPQFRALLHDNAAEFYRRCGDEFVAGKMHGGELYAIAAIPTTSQLQKNQLIGKFSPSLDLDGFTTTLSATQPQITIGQSKNLVELGPIEPSIAGVAKALKNATSEIFSGPPVAYAAVTLPYSVAGDAAEDYDIAGFRRAKKSLDKVGKSYLATEEKLKSVNYVLQHPNWFAAHDPASMQQLRGQLEQTLGTLRTWTQACLSDRSLCASEPEVSASATLPYYLPATELLDEPDAYRVGNEYSSITTADYVACLAACRIDGRCQSYTWFTNGACKLRNAIPWTSWPSAGAHTGVRAAKVPHCQPAPKSTIEMHCTVSTHWCDDAGQPHKTVVYPHGPNCIEP